MESATLTSPRPGHGFFARLKAAPERAWARAGFALLCVGALIAYVVYPTYPNYDSAYALVWGRELLHGVAPSFDAYRAPTEHPLAVGVGALVALLGGSVAPHAWLLLTIAAFCLLIAGVYRLGRAGVGAGGGVGGALRVL